MTAPSLPRFVVLEGVDGSGKTTLAAALRQGYLRLLPDHLLYAGAFPGSHPGTLGSLVYELHHGRAPGAPAVEQIAPPALQLLHVAAHVDAIIGRIGPIMKMGGHVILDRFWWSTYAYARLHLPSEDVWPMVNAEAPFWRDLPAPVVVYLRRSRTLKAEELSSDKHALLDAYYGEVITHERARGMIVHELSNDGALPETWASLLRALAVPEMPFPAV